MRRRFAAYSVLLLCVVLVAGCEVPTPPPELPTPTPGSQNPENPQSQLALTQVAPTPLRDFEPLNVPSGYIYFVRDVGLWRIAPGGASETMLSDLPVTSVPQPSPDGKRVAFTSGDEL